MQCVTYKLKQQNKKNKKIFLCVSIVLTAERGKENNSKADHEKLFSAISSFRDTNEMKIMCLRESYHLRAMHKCI